MSNKPRKRNTSAKRKGQSKAKRKIQKVTMGGISIEIPQELGVASGVKNAADKVQALSGGNVEKSSPPKKDSAEIKCLIEVATHLWRVQGRIIDRETKEPKDGFERVARDLERMANALDQAKVQVVDPTGRSYDSGMALKVLNFEPSPGISTDTVTETIKPGIVFEQYLVQWPEVIVATPLETTESKPEGEDHVQTND